MNSNPQVLQPFAQPAPTASRPAKALFGYVALLSSGALLLRALQIEPVPNGAMITSFVLLGLCFLPLLFWQLGSRQGAPMFEIICAMFAVAYVLPVFLHENIVYSFNSVTRLDWVRTEEALGLVILGVAAMVTGYYGFGRFPAIRSVPRADLPFSSQGYYRFLWLAFAFAGSLRLTERLLSASWGRGVTGALSSLISFLLLSGIALLSARAFRSDTSGWRERAVLAFAVLASVVVGLGAGMLEEGFVPLVVAFVARWYYRRRFPWFLLTVGTAGFFLLNAAKYEYRSELWYAPRTYTIPEQVGLWVKKCQEVVESLDTPGSPGTVLQRTIYRFDLIHITSQVVDLTPKTIPHYGGSSYGYLFYGWIPRFVWPDKPIAQEANVAFALDYGLLIESQTDTTRIGIGFLGEAYANFGQAGVIVVMFLIGAAFGIVNHIFNGPRSEGGRAVYMAVLAFYLNGIGSATTMFIFFGLQGFLVIPLIMRFYCRGWRATLVQADGFDGHHSQLPEPDNQPSAAH